VIGFEYNTVSPEIVEGTPGFFYRSFDLRQRDGGEKSDSSTVTIHESSPLVVHLPCQLQGLSIIAKMDTGRRD
jgi:hypothetical protein